MKRAAFTLIELIISIIILSILMLFLYKSYASLNRSNALFSKEVAKIEKIEKIKKALYLDITLAMPKSIEILNQDKRIDVVYFESRNSLHKRVNPYIAYVVVDKKLYRLESLKPFVEYPFGVESEFEADYLGKVKRFRLYRSTANATDIYLLHTLFEDGEEILLKIKVLNPRL